MKIKLGMLCGAIAVAGYSSATVANVTIGNLASWDRLNSIGNFGVPDTSTYGQTFVVPTGHQDLIRFQFLMLATSVGSHPFNFYVMPWDDGDQVGVSDPIYEADGLVASDPTQWRSVVVNPNITLKSGSEYIAFISTSDTDRGTDWTSNVAAVDAGTYSDGKFYYLNNGETKLDWTVLSWQSSPFSQMAFSATFANQQQTPEPATFLVLGTALALFRRRKSTK